MTKLNTGVIITYNKKGNIKTITTPYEKDITYKPLEK